MLQCRFVALYQKHATPHGENLGFLRHGPASLARTLLSKTIMLANFSLICATIFSCSYIYYTQFSKSPGGDAGVGHAFVTFFFLKGAVISLGVIAVLVGIKGGFSWLGSNSITRFFIVLVCFLLIMYGLVFFGDPGIKVGRSARHICSFLLVLMLLCWSAIHLKDGLRAAVPMSVSKWLSIAILALGMVPLVAQVTLRQINLAKARSMRGELDSFEKGIAARIDSTDVQKGIGSLLVHTAEGRHPIIREKALAKLKSRPDWQEEMVRLLNEGDGPNVFNYLSSNAVDNMAIFPEAINQGILTLAEMVRESIRNCSHRDHLRSDSFFFEVHDLLKSLKPFQKAGYDFTPALQTLRDAFNERCEFDKPRFNAAKMLDKALDR